MNRREAILAAIAAVLAAFIPTRGIRQCVWTGAVSSDWHDALNWKGKRIPQAGDDVLIRKAPYDCIASKPVDVRKARIECGGCIQITSAGKVAAIDLIEGSYGVSL